MSDSFRIALLGQAAFGESVLNSLVEEGKDVVSVFCPPDTEGRPHDPVKVAAGKHGIPVQQFGRLRDQEPIDTFKALNVDLCVMAFVTDIVPMDIITAPKEGTINFHPSLLPLHRGPSSINWPIIQGRTKTGFSIFWPDEGLDTGPILLQREVVITPDDTLGSVYFKKIFPAAVQGMIEAVNLVENGNAPRIEQDHSKATYESWCKAKDVIIDWNETIETVYNLVRGSDPSPGSGTTFKGDAIKFFNTSKSGSANSAIAGEVVEVTDESFSIAGKGGTLTVSRVQPVGSKKLPAGEWAAEVGLSAGMRFGD